MNKKRLLQKNLLAWYDKYGRKDLPWQVEDPYFVWISEIMLQQTQVLKVVNYFNAFTQRFPTLKILAQSQVSDVLLFWSGLGYYNRARNIHKTALICEEEFQAKLPQELKQLVALPGIGRTTAGAILSLAFNKPYPIMDGNVKRVMSRVFTIKAETLSQLDKKLWEKVTPLVSQERPKNYNQALMDLGSMVCVRSNPLCQKCPLSQLCQANQTNETHLYPQKKSKTKQVAVTLYAVLFKQDDQVLLQQRPNKGIWAELWFLPLYDTAKEQRERAGVVTHQFEIVHVLSHRILTIKVIESRHKENGIPGEWLAIDKLQDKPHPSALVKIIKQSCAKTF